MTFYSVLASVLPIIALTFLQNAILANKQEKAKLSPLVFISAVYALAGVMLIWKYHIELEALLFAYDLIDYSVIIFNMVLMLGFIVIKITIGDFLKKRITKREFIELLAGHFYSYAEEYDKWFLQFRWANYRVFLNSIRWGIVVAAGLFLSFIYSRNGETMVTLTFPCTVVIIFNEVYHFINGQTREEFEHSILGDDTYSRRAGDYFRVREAYEHLLPDPMLSSLTGFELEGKSSALDLIKKLSQSENKVDRLTADYFMSDRRYIDADADGVRLTANLMHRRNVVIHDPFYRDLDMYITLPLFHALVSGKKTVVITGRKSFKNDVREWLSELLSKYTHMPSLWHADNLGTQSVSSEIGVLSFPELYQSGMFDNNEEFFSKTELVILIEPSAILSTGQIALSILSREMEKGENRPVYFVCDRMADGLVDTLSHLLRTEFVDVVAPPIPHCTYTGITWDSDGDYRRQQLFDRQTRYLGNGVELSAIALKNQIPHVTWLSERKIPIRDIKWIAGKNYPAFCQYINQPIAQNTIYEKLDFQSNLWNSPKIKEQFAIVEDEFDNMFMTLRMYLSRGLNQSFINVISENYLLRDYMRFNQDLFMTNPDSVPSLVPDYAKTERNTLIKLIIIMRRHALTEWEIIEEFHLVGHDSDSAYDLLNAGLIKYFNVSADILDIDSIEKEVDELTTDTISIYSINDESFNRYFSNSLAEAYYIDEDETGYDNYVDARMFSHVTQAILPDQFVTYDGKYYRVKHISPQTGVVLRRAADLFDERKYYRQIRNYELSGGNDIILSYRKKDGVEFVFIEKDIHVVTTGYLDMKDNHDLKTARVVDLSNDPLVDNYSRDYKNKTLLKITLPEIDEDARFTFCVILSELMRTLFPDAYPYIAVTTKKMDEISNISKYTIYPIHGDVDDSGIYIIEDSDMDLGLIGAIERNWDKIIDIITDFLSWHFDQMYEPESIEPTQPSFAFERKEVVVVEKKKQTWFQKISDRFKQLFPNKSTDDTDISIESENTVAEFNKDEIISESDDVYSSVDPIAVTPEIDGNESADTAAESSDIEKSIANEGEIPSAEIEHNGETIEEKDTAQYTETNVNDTLDDLNSKTPKDTNYTRNYFLKYGYPEIDSSINPHALLAYLKSHVRVNNALTQARIKTVFEKTDLDIESVNRCDFCGKPLSGVSYDVISDGRVRCSDCSASAISSVEDLKSLFYQVSDLMEAFFRIKYRVPINVRMTDAKSVSKGAGMVFVPSTEFASRVIGYAQKNKENYSLVLENGSPRLASTETIVHELTHIWQYINWDPNDVQSAYEMNEAIKNSFARDMIYEGMAVWVSIQYLYQIGESRYAAMLERDTESRMDAYGLGFKLYNEQYPITKGSSILKVSPFASFPPIDPEEVKKMVNQVIKD